MITARGRGQSDNEERKPNAWGEFNVGGRFVSRKSIHARAKRPSGH
jgi:hypothetical protein